MARKYVLGLDLGASFGVARVFTDGGIDAQTFRFEANIGSRTVGIVKRFAGPDCIGVCIEEQFSGQFSSVKAIFPILGAAILACELEGLSWSAVHLARLKTHATGRQSAKKPDIQAAAKAPWDVSLKEDEADAAWAGAYELDTFLFD